MTMTTAIAGNSRQAGPEYCFSLDRLAELNRSAIPLLLARLNTACPSFGKSPADIADPADLIAEIRAHCAGDSDFIQQSMPLQEIVFRTLLLHGDAPMTLVDLHRELTERWSSPIRPITVTVAGLARVLDNDVFYGFAVVPAAQPEVAEPSRPMLSAAEADDAGLLAAEADDAGLLAEVFAAIAAGEEEDEEEDEDPYDDDEDDDPFDEDDD